MTRFILPTSVARLCNDQAQVVSQKIQPRANALQYVSEKQEKQLYIANIDIE